MQVVEMNQGLHFLDFCRAMSGTSLLLLQITGCQGGRIIELIYEMLRFFLLGQKHQDFEIHEGEANSCAALVCLELLSVATS